MRSSYRGEYFSADSVVCLLVYFVVLLFCFFFFFFFFAFVVVLFLSLRRRRRRCCRLRLRCCCLFVCLSVELFALVVVPATNNSVDWTVASHSLAVAVIEHRRNKRAVCRTTPFTMSKKRANKNIRADVRSYRIVSQGSKPKVEYQLMCCFKAPTLEKSVLTWEVCGFGFCRQ